MSKLVRGAPQIRGHHDAALATGGGHLPVALRETLSAQRPKRGSSQGTRAGKRVPKRAKRAAARAGRPGGARS